MGEKTQNKKTQNNPQMSQTEVRELIFYQCISLEYKDIMGFTWVCMHPGGKQSTVEC